VCQEAGLTAKNRGVEWYGTFRSRESGVLTYKTFFPSGLVASQFVDSEGALVLADYRIL
jgi:hypothetical protein